MGRRETFDATRSFVANKDFRWAGIAITGGQPFTDKSNPRRLRQLYDSRYLRMLPPEVVAEDENDGRPIFASMSEDELRTWMHERNVIAHPRTTLEGLVKKAKLLWEEIKQGILRPALATETGDGVVFGGGQQPDPPRDREGVQEPAGQGSRPTRTRLRGRQ